MTAATDVAAPPRSPDRLSALRQRLGVTAAALGLDTRVAPETTLAVSQLYGRLVEHVHGDPGTDSLWLLMTAMSGALPEPEDIRAGMRARDLGGPADLATWLLEASYVAAGDAGSPDLEMDVVASAVVVDVDFTARHDLHTGIQRVVRETVPRWHREHELVLAAWTEAGGAMRSLGPAETDRILRWHGARAAAGAAGTGRPPHRLLVPWHCTVLFPENPPPEHCPAVAAMSLYSGSRTGLIGYDCIPAISPDLIPPGLPDRFMRYLEAVKHAHRVAGISAAATREFAGFVDMLVAQGLRGPSVVECVLPVEMPPGEPVAGTGAPLVVCIGSFEPRKNQLAVLHAAEHLWRAGLDFRLEFIGGSGLPTEFDAMLGRLVAAGRPVRRRTAVSDEQLWGTVRAARFSVFVSLHEGFGLPVAESLACGTPCLTSDTGSTREIAAGGGAVTVDPTDDLAIAEQMRRLLTDDQLVSTLREQALRRCPRTWDDYARELWAALVVGQDTGQGPR
ncbi:glycosyltransferase family 4 protein [Blastococcus sp. PRF04-17]|uniref:glycosyltransferase family 4 protein n=1 Tax=Blastococcus sp. PRF04-17 TaxID=2933797 RepID=UPI001FF31B2D|nr:glycosyltransferase family 1 protein [Blastococcus sp. PRF04-17]UOY01222.1 glycosyltransferase family 4 protein [Blastococcus sp. PRF04-17]